MLFLIVVGGIYFLAIQNHFVVISLENKEFIAYLRTENPVLIDLREEDEISREPLNYHSILHLPFLTFEKTGFQLSLDKNKKYVIICSDGNRSRLVATVLAENGLAIPYLQKGLWSLRQEINTGQTEFNRFEAIF